MLDTRAILFYNIAIMINDNLLTIAELARYLKVKPRTIYDWLIKRKVPAVKLVGQWRFKKETIDAWIKKMETRF